MQIRRKQKPKNDLLDDDSLNEQQNKDIQTFAEIIVDIVMKELEKENSKTLTVEDKTISYEKP